MLRNPFARNEPNPEEKAYRRLAQRGFAPAAIVDVGAYEGNWTRLAKRVFPDASVIMCEAQPGKREFLEAVCRDLPNVSYVSALMGAKAGEELEFSEMETGSSIYPENSNVARTTRTLPTRVLDDVAGELEGPCFLKIDVQGAELMVLEGAAQFLDKCDFVQLEVALLDYNKGAPTFLEVIEYMDARDFVPFDISGSSRPNGVDLVQVDLLFARRGSARRPSYFEF